MTTEPSHRDFDPAAQREAVRAGSSHRISRRILHEGRAAVVPTLFFFIGFNSIVLTTNLLVAEYLVAVSSFMLATMAALVVGKAVLVANSLPIIRLFDRAPLLQPILFKTVVYWVIVFVARLLERFVHFSVIERHTPRDFPMHLVTTFSWHRFAAISLWLLILFLVYVTASEFSQLFGPGEIRRLMFTARPSNLQLTRRQRVRELLRLSRIADEHRAAELEDPTSPAYREVFDIMRRLAR
jgi:hypothetical protein